MNYIITVRAFDDIETILVPEPHNNATSNAIFPSDKNDKHSEEIKKGFPGWDRLTSWMFGISDFSALFMVFGLDVWFSVMIGSDFPMRPLTHFLSSTLHLS